MGHHQLRKDKTCLNCRHVVAEKFCPNCGQENSDTRKTFHHLFVHFFEDLTHYENAFWKTIRNLLLRPAALTKEYLSGRRMSYLAPVRLYIFISFVTFLLMGLLPSQTEDHVDLNPKKKAKKEHTLKEIETALDSASVAETGEKYDHDWSVGSYDSVREFDSVQHSLPEAKRMHGFEKWFQRKLAHTSEQTDKEDFDEKLLEGIVHNIPKALFLYMPFFAFFLWVFHDKKRWYYFDHGIFTLHYFSFMLVTLSLYMIINALLSYTVLDWISNFVSLFMMCWWFFYFFRSHSRFYGEEKWISRLKGAFLFFINVVLLSFFVIALLIYTVLYLH